jgi:SAM-dependent methyltransferase
VLLLHVIEHFPQQLQTSLLKETLRVLIPGGTFIISTPNLGTLWNANKFLPPNNPKHFHCLHREELQDLLQQVGFRNLRRHGYDIFLEYPNPFARLIPYSLRRAFASVFSMLEKYLIFTAVKE